MAQIQQSVLFFDFLEPSLHRSPASRNSELLSASLSYSINRPSFCVRRLENKKGRGIF